MLSRINRKYLDISGSVRSIPTLVVNIYSRGAQCSEKYHIRYMIYLNISKDLGTAYYKFKLPITK